MCPMLYVVGVCGWVWVGGGDRSVCVKRSPQVKLMGVCLQTQFHSDYFVTNEYYILGISDLNITYTCIAQKYIFTSTVKVTVPSM